MSIPQTFVLLPCHSLEDFPTHCEGVDADSLLANWTAAWHPQLIGMTQKQPAWLRAENPGDVPGGSLFLVPSVAQNALPEDYNRNEKPNGVHLIAGISNREELLGLIFDHCQIPVSQQFRNTQLAEQANDFLALGYGYLQVQLMTRQLRGSTNLDESQFENVVVSAAHSWNQADTEATSKHLSRCFDLLLAEKNAYYPVQPDLLELVLTSPTTLGTSFNRELETDHPKSILLTSELCGQLREEHPGNFARFKQLVQNERLNIVGGLDTELKDPLLSAETTVHQIRRAVQWYQQELGIDLSVFARRSFGLTAELPSILNQFNFIGALHCTMAGGTLPMTSTTNIRWEGVDSASVPALSQSPEDANDGSVFLGLGVQLGKAIDSAHTATVLLAHWPNRTHFSFKDLLRIRKFGPLFGSLKTLNDYFDAIYDPGYGDSFTADEYRGEYLRASVRTNQSDPISKIVNYWRRTYRLRSLRTAAVQSLILNTGSDELQTMRPTSAKTIEQIQTRVDRASEMADGSLDKSIQDLENQINVPGSGNNGEWLIANTTNFDRTVWIRTENRDVHVKSADESVRFVDSRQDFSDWVLRVPPISVTPLKSARQDQAAVSREPPIGLDNVLRNEFFEIVVDKETGGIRSIDKYDRRKNLLSQQLSVRIPGPKDGYQQPLTRARYAKMVCDELSMNNQSKVRATITASGRLINIDDDTQSTVAEFEQTVSVVRGKPIVEIDVRLTPLIELTADPNHYFCNRFAWKHESVELYRGIQETRAFVMDDHFEAPNWIDIKGKSETATVLTGGLCFHRRSSKRMLDTLLIVAGESQRRFRFAVGLNLQYPLRSAVDFLTPPILLSTSDIAETRSGWFFHFNCKNVLATWWSPILDSQDRCIGVEVRLRETEDRAGQLQICSPFELTSARRVNFLGDHLQSVQMKQNTASINFHGSEYFQVQLNWDS